MRIIEIFLGPHRMELNIDKCTHLSVNLLSAKKKLYTSTLAQILLDDHPIPQIGLFNYLGLQFHPTSIQQPE